MRTISVKELRLHLGDVLTAVSMLGEEIVLTRSGRAVAMLTPLPGIPVGSMPDSSPDGRETVLAGKSGSAA